MRYYLLTLLLALLFLMGSCFEGDPLHDITGARLNNYGGIVSDTLYAVADTSIVEGKVSTANGGKLLIGSYADFDTRFLIRFGNLPPDSVRIDSLTLILTSESNQGDDIMSLTGSAYLVTEEWDESINSDEFFDYRTIIDYSAETTTQFELTDSSRAIQLIELPPAMMESWTDTTGGGQNFGMLLDYDNASYIKEFTSRHSSFVGQWPRMAVVYYDAALDSVFHDTLIANKDASLIDFNGSFDPNQLFVSSGYVTRSFFNFDLSKIPPTAAMATMNFEFKRDSIGSVKNNNKSEFMNVRTITTEYNLLPYYEADSTFIINIFYNPSIIETSDNVLGISEISRGNASQNFLQDILNGDIPYGSFMFQYEVEGNDVSVYSIKNSEHPDIEERPKLIIEYYVIPDPRL